MDALFISTPKTKFRHAGTGVAVKTGNVFVIFDNKGLPLKRKLFVKVFRDSGTHHADLYSGVNCEFKYGTLGLRKCLVSKNVDSNLITVKTLSSYQNGELGLGLTFEVDSDIEEWVDCLTPSASCSRMPISPATYKRLI